MWAKVPPESGEQMAMLTTTAVVSALNATHGNVSAAARSLGVTRRAVGKRINGDAALKQALIDAREAMVDDAERALADAVKDGQPWAVQFVLKTLGKSRGYVERKEQATTISGPDGAPISTETTFKTVDFNAKLRECGDAIRAAALATVVEHLGATVETRIGENTPIPMPRARVATVSQAQ
jgi:hypothetical protein